MAENKTTIEDLPVDALSRIMMQVAITPNGTIEIFNSSFICKAFHSVSNDEYILKTVVFEDLSTYCLSFCDPSSLVHWDGRFLPDLSSQFEAFQKIGGYVLKAAKKDNLSAQMILAKLIIRSTSELFHVTNEASSSEIPPVAKEDYKLSMLAKASSFIAHFMPQEIDEKLVHYNLVKKYLNQASLKELQLMKNYIKDYVTYYYNPKLNYSSKKVLVLLDEFKQVQNTILPQIRGQLYAKSFNCLCSSGIRFMRGLGMDPKVLQAQIIPKKERNYYLNSQDLMNRFVILEVELLEGLKKASNPCLKLQGYAGTQSLPNSWITRRIVAVKEGLSWYLQHLEYIAKLQADLITKFDALFSIS